MSINQLISKQFAEHSHVIENVHNKTEGQIIKACELISEGIKNKKTIFWCGNGGSAADSQHLAAEFVGRFKENRKALRSIALTTDTSVLTSIGNDNGYEEVFARQIEALGNPLDVLIAISTSGNSANIVKALKKAKSMGLKTLALLGKDGGEARNHSDYSLIVPSSTTARIQEAHILIGHIICEFIEKDLGLA